MALELNVTRSLLRNHACHQACSERGARMRQEKKAIEIRRAEEINLIEAIALIIIKGINRKPPHIIKHLVEARRAGRRT